MKTITLNTPCFTVQDGQIVAGTLADFDHFIERTTRPHGVGCKHYVTEITRDGVDVWAHAKWATWGGPETIIDTYETEAEAQAAVEQTYVYDILNNPEQCINLDRASAEAELAQILENEA